MLEDEEPLLGLRALVQPAASLERYERLEVVAHDPRKREVGGGRHDIRDEACLLAAAVDKNGLVIRHVPRRRQGPNAGQDFHLAVDQLERNALEIGGEVTPGGAFVGMAGKIELALFFDVAGGWERGDGPSRGGGSNFGPPPRGSEGGYC